MTSFNGYRTERGSPEAYGSAPEPSALYGNIDLFHDFVKSGKVSTINDL